MAESVANSPAEKTGGAAPIPGLPADWDRLATEKIISTVDQVRIKTSGPAIGVARLVVFGILGAVLALVAVVVFLIGLVRLLNVAIPKDVWLVYLILGALFIAGGALLWSKRPRRATS